MRHWKDVVGDAMARRKQWVEDRPNRLRARVEKSAAYKVLSEGCPEGMDENDEAWLMHDASRVRALMVQHAWNWAAAVLAAVFLAGLGGWYAHKLTWSPPQQVVEWYCEVAVDKATKEREIVTCSGQTLPE